MPFLADFACRLVLTALLCQSPGLSDAPTPLEKAIRANDAVRVSELIQQGADPNEPFVRTLSFGFTIAPTFLSERKLTPPLVLAACMADASVVSALIAGGADLNGRTSRDGFTPVIGAARRCHPSDAAVVPILLSAGADAKLADQEIGRNALMWAAANGSLENVRALLSAGVDLRVTRKLGRFERSVLHDGRLRQDALRHVVGRLIREHMPVPLNQEGLQGPKQETPGLIRASMISDVDAVKKMVAEGADVNVRDQEGWTALMWAASFAGGETLSKLLLDSGADVNAETMGGWTALMSSILTEDLAQVRLMLRGGANPNVAERFLGTTPLILACQYTNAEIVELLLLAGADPEAVDKRKLGTRQFLRSNKDEREAGIQAVLDRHVNSEPSA